MLENKEQEKIAGIISDFFDGTVSEADIDILAMKIYAKYVAELEQELAEIKEKAIVPRFRIGQEVYSVFINREYMECNEVCNLEITHIMKSKNGIFYQDNNKNAYWFNEKNTFLTEQEAKAKLQELRG